MPCNTIGWQVRKQIFIVERREFCFDIRKYLLADIIV